jgi:hypothetical protein
MFDFDVPVQVMVHFPVQKLKTESGVATIDHADIREFYARQYIRRELPRSTSAGRAA